MSQAYPASCCVDKACDYNYTIEAGEHGQLRVIRSAYENGNVTLSPKTTEGPPTTTTRGLDPNLYAEVCVGSNCTCKDGLDVI